MSNNDNNVKLYNILIPLWWLWLFPMTWVIVISGNFIIDNLILIISMVVLKMENKKQWYKQYIFKIFAFGILAEIIGAWFMFLMLCVLDPRGWDWDELYVTIPGLILSAVLIFAFNYKYTFKKIDKVLRFRLSIIFTVFSTPYAFLVPSNWLHW